MNCTMRKIRAKVGNFHELREIYVKKSEESSTTVLSFTKTSSYKRANSPLRFRDGNLWCR